MLGNPVSAESLVAFGGQAATDDGDALEGAEHARLLVEDCRRMLLGASQLPIGAWGLIDADPKYVHRAYPHLIDYNQIEIPFAAPEIQAKPRSIPFFC